MIDIYIMKVDNSEGHKIMREENIQFLKNFEEQTKLVKGRLLEK